MATIIIKISDVPTGVAKDVAQDTIDDIFNNSLTLRPEQNVITYEVKED